MPAIKGYCHNELYLRSLHCALVSFIILWKFYKLWITFNKWENIRHKHQFKRKYFLILILASIFENLSLLPHENKIAKTAFPSYVLIIFTANPTVTDDVCLETLIPHLFTFLESFRGSNESLEVWNVSLTLFFFCISRSCMRAQVKTMLKWNNCHVSFSAW